MSTILVVLIAVVGGIAAALQSQALGIMNGRAGTIESVFVTYGAGGLVVGLVLLVLRGNNLTDLKTAPLWVYGAGLFGLVVVGSLAIATNEIGAARALTVFTAASLILGALIDHFGWLDSVGRTIGASQLAGFALVLAGTWLVVR